MSWKNCKRKLVSVIKTNSKIKSKLTSQDFYEYKDGCLMYTYSDSKNKLRHIHIYSIHLLLNKNCDLQYSVSILSLRIKK